MTTDCGCGGSTAASTGQRPTGGRQAAGKVAPRGSTATREAKTDRSAGNGGAPDAVGAGPIIRLNPTDGLFLKAEHLDQIQNYARALSVAVGLGSGAGVVHGYGLELASKVLTASAGLAFSTSGHALQSSELLRISVETDDLPALEPDGFWVVEIVPEEDTVGAENAYGAVCADPCEGVGSIAPWARSLVRLRLRKDELLGLGARTRARRNWLASAYFERERRRLQPWLVPGERLPGAPGTVPSLSSRLWSEPGGEPDGSAVALGVLLRVEGELVLDTWTARRELSGPPGVLRWDGHLARRSWPVFLAQVLQFQDQVRGENLALTAVDHRAVVDRRAEAVEKYIASIPPAVANWEAVKEFRKNWRAAEGPYELKVEGKTLTDIGIDELPPAGYLELTGAGDEGRAEVTRIFADAVELRFCEARADAVADAVQSAQHLDRIPLDPTADPKPRVDILVPSRSADLEGLTTSAYGWVAFLRNSRPDCGDETPEPPEPEPETDAVQIAYTLTRLDEGLPTMAGGSLPSSTPIAVVEFPKGRPEVPPGTGKPAELDDVDIIGVVATAGSDAAVTLAVKRADGLLADWAPAFTSKSVAHAHFHQPVIMFFVTGRIN